MWTYNEKFDSTNTYFVIVLILRQKHRQALLDQVKSKEIGLKEQYNSKIAENEESFSCQSSLKSEQPTPPTYSKEQYLKQFRDQNKFVRELLIYFIQ